MKNKTGTEETDPYNASRPLGGIDVPCTDPGAMSHTLKEDTPIEAKVREENALRDVTEHWYWKGYNDAMDKCRAIVHTAFDFGDKEE